MFGVASLSGLSASHYLSNTHWFFLARLDPEHQLPLFQNLDAYWIDFQ